MRVIGVDLGDRRIGLAISDATATLARPLKTIERGTSDEAAAEALRVAITELSAEDEVGCLVLGLPTRLDGSANEQTVRVQKMATLLSARLTIPVVMQDERLSSHEAGERLATKERDWRKRKAKLDAAAAAVILQDYLDGHREGGRGEREEGRGERENEAASSAGRRGPRKRSGWSGAGGPATKN